jgi:phage antirepressor YoqD-like protein
LAFSCSANNRSVSILALVAAEEEKELLIAQNEEQKELLTIQAPKVDMYEDFLSKDDLYSVGDIAKTLAIKDMGKNNLYKYLRNKKIFMEGYEAYQRFVRDGYVVHRNRTYTYGKGDKSKTVTEICGYFTPKGVEYLYKKLKKDGYSTKKSLQQVVDELNVVTE